MKQTTFELQFGVTIIDLRNFLEHPNEDKRTEIDDFVLTPEGHIRVPSWYVTGNEPSSIAEDMQGMVVYLTGLLEEMFIHLIMNTINKKIPTSFRI